MPSEEWTNAEHVRRYLGRADQYPRRAEGDSVLLEYVPRGARRILDLGTGDGRLLSLLRMDRPEMLSVGVDFSDLMLARARERFDGDERIELVEHDLDQPLPALGRFDAVVSSFAIHHLEHERKRSLYAEVFDLLEPGGVFANFEHVASPTHRLHLAFFAAIGEPLEDEDPSDRLLDVAAGLLVRVARSAGGRLAAAIVVILAVGRESVLRLEGAVGAGQGIVHVRGVNGDGAGRAGRFAVWRAAKAWLWPDFFQMS